MKTRTALVKGKNGYSVKRYNDYRSNAEFAADLRGNGYQVVKIWACHKSDEEISEWQFLNRK